MYVRAVHLFRDTCALPIEFGLERYASCGFYIAIDAHLRPSYVNCIIILSCKVIDKSLNEIVCQ